MKSANWISAIGMRPFNAAPTATPTMADSASGVSRTRDSPNLAYRPSVAPNTPPLRPTSSPITSTRPSRSISSAMAARTASIIRISGISCQAHCPAPAHPAARRLAASRTRCQKRMSFESTGCATSGVRLTKGGGLNNLPGGERYFVLGGRQERDGRADAGAALLSAERAARHLFRLTRPPADEKARTLRLLLAASQRRRPQSRAAGSRGGSHGRQVPGGQDPQAHVFLHRAGAPPGPGRDVHTVGFTCHPRSLLRPQGHA